MFGENHSEYSFNHSTRLEKSVIIICFLTIALSMVDFVIAGHFDGCHVYFVNLSIYFFTLGSFGLGTPVIIALNLDSNIQRRLSMYGVNEDLMRFKYDHSCVGLFAISIIIIETFVGVVVASIVYLENDPTHADNTCYDNRFYDYFLIRTALASGLMILGCIAYGVYLCYRKNKPQLNYFDI